ncbi:MAG: helix-turn-helix transcriptional regulator [Actinomycetota bacterium]|nr:helix-turn-helix transcriptional regulator [Actinomycetota bacterium]
MTIDPAQLQGHLDGMVLSVLTAEPGHGYDVVRRLGAASDGVFELPEGTVYPALHRLERAGLLASRWETVEGRRRRVYQLTAAGRVRLGERRRGWQRFAGAVSAVLAPVPGSTA